MTIGFENALKTFNWAANTIPAYKDFLKKHNINPDLIKSENDFYNLPIMDKDNYLGVYPYENLFPNKKIPPMVSASSGSSGEPFYWARSKEQSMEGGKIHENIFKYIFGFDNCKTLAIICFSMGTWVAGTFTNESCQWISEQGYDLTTITPGIEKEDTLAILKKFAPNFNQVILAGYPPFVMDIINAADRENINLKSLNLKFLFAGENFSETWRDTIHSMAGIPTVLYGSTNIYGTADAAILGHETPLSIYIRRIAEKDNEFFKKIFVNLSFLPTLIQYYPDKKFFELYNNELIFTSKSGIPLIRYNIHDNGNIISYDQMINVLSQTDKIEYIKSKQLDHWKLPFIYLSGRKDVAVSFYAVNIYPENIKAGLEDGRIKKFITGKFVAETKLADNQIEQELIINVELSKNTRASRDLNKLAGDCIFQNLTSLNAEFRKLSKSINDQAKPKINLIVFDDERFQVKKSKHRWIS